MSDEQRTSRRKILGTTGLALAGAITGSSVASASQETETETGTADGNGGDMDGQQEVMEVISDWEQKQRETAKKTMDEYGVPEGVTQRRLIWYDADPWKRIELFRDATQHNFPTQHPDFFEQFIDYQVPSHKADELMEFDGSVMFERTTGVLSARCDREPANFLAINLANDIVTDQKTVEEARRTYAETMIQVMNGESPSYTQGFQFELPEGDQRDPDVEVIQNGEVDLEGASGTKTDTDRGTATDRTTGTATEQGTATTTDQE